MTGASDGARVTKLGDTVDQLSDLVRETNWEELTPRLLAYASLSLTRYPSRIRSGRTPHDYVVRAVMEVLENSEHYSQTAPKSMFDLVAVIIAQLIAADVHGASTLNESASTKRQADRQRDRG